MYGADELFIYLDGRDASLTPALLREGAWERGISHWIDEALADGDCFVDIGANNGIHALHAARKVGRDGVVIAFEPQERLCQLIERSASANLMIDILHARRSAIGSSAGTVKIGKFAYLSGSATLTSNHRIIDSEEVSIATLPDALEQVSREIARRCDPDVIKIDVEGFEYEVWDGMKEWTLQRPKLAIVIEFSPVSYQNSGRDALRFLEEFVEYGFHVAQLNGSGSVQALDRADFVRMAQARAQFNLVLTKGRVPDGRAVRP